MAKKKYDPDDIFADLSDNKKAGGGEITTSGKVRDFMHKTVGIPMAINQLGYDVFGGQSPITENSLNDEELKSLRNVVRSNLKNGQNTIQYRDWNKAGAKNTDNIKQVLDAAGNPTTNLKLTLGRARIDINNNDTTVVDTYNFNEKSRKKDLGSWWAATKDIGIKDPYNQFRNIGTYFGSDEQHGSPVKIKINQKENGGELNTINMKNKYDNMFFLGGMKPPEAGSLAGTAGGVAGSLSGFIPTDTRGGAAASGALKGASMGMAAGPWGALIGAGVGAGAAFLNKNKEMNKAQFATQSNEMQERNKMFGIMAKGGLIFPMGVNQNQVTNYAMGGDLTEFNAGGSHEDNANGGVLQGVDENGIPNKVEQGETKWNDYIFSDRLTLDDNLIKQYNMPDSAKGKTFAHMSKRFNKSLKERPNDPITRNTAATNMEALQAANDQEIAKQDMMNQQKQMAYGGNLFGDGGGKLVAPGKRIYDYNRATEREGLLNTLKPDTNFDVDPFDNPFSAAESSPVVNDYSELESQLHNQKDLGYNKQLFNMPNLPKNSLRYAPVAFNALAGALSKTPKPHEYSPTLIQQSGELSAPRVDEQALRTGIDTGYQNQLRGLADASGSSLAALRAGQLGAGANYMSALGQGFLGANQSNLQAKQSVDQYNLQSRNANASQNAQLMNQADQYNTQTKNARDLANYETKMSYLGQAAQDLGEIGKENRFAEIMPSIYGYDQYAQYTAGEEGQSKYLPKFPGQKKCGGKLRLRMKK